MARSFNLCTHSARLIEFVLYQPSFLCRPSTTAVPGQRQLASYLRANLMKSYVCISKKYVIRQFHLNTSSVKFLHSI